MRSTFYKFLTLAKIKRTFTSDGKENCSCKGSFSIKNVSIVFLYLIKEQ